MTVIKGKRCNTCRKRKPYSDYYPSTGYGDGMMSDCIMCTQRLRKEFERKQLAAKNKAEVKRTAPKKRVNSPTTTKARYAQESADIKKFNQVMHMFPVIRGNDVN